MERVQDATFQDNNVGCKWTIADGLAMNTINIQAQSNGCHEYTINIHDKVAHSATYTLAHVLPMHLLYIIPLGSFLTHM